MFISTINSKYELESGLEVSVCPQDLQMIFLKHFKNCAERRT